MKSNKVNITITIPLDLVKKIEDLAKKMDTSRSYVVVHLLKQNLDDSNIDLGNTKNVKKDKEE